MNVLRRAIADTVGHIKTLFGAAFAGIISLIALFLWKGRDMAIEEIPFVIVGIVGAAAGVFSIFLWNLACAPYRLEKGKVDGARAAEGAALQKLAEAEEFAASEVAQAIKERDIAQAKFSRFSILLSLRAAEEQLERDHRHLDQATHWGPGDVHRDPHAHAQSMYRDRTRPLMDQMISDISKVLPPEEIKVFDYSDMPDAVVNEMEHGDPGETGTRTNYAAFLKYRHSYNKLIQLVNTATATLLRELGMNSGQLDAAMKYEMSLPQSNQDTEAKTRR